MEQILSEAGFTNKGQIQLKYEPTGEVFTYTLFILDWGKLHIIMQENPDREILIQKQKGTLLTSPLRNSYHKLATK